MKKIVLITTTCFFYFSFFSFAQGETSINLKGYNSKNYQQYFDSLHIKNVQKIRDLNHSYDCYVVFKIAKNSISNFEFIEIPKAELPEVAKKYIYELFSTTKGMWEYKKIDRIKIEANEFLFSISLLKTNQTIKERVKDSEYYFEFALEKLKHHKRLNEYSLLNEKKITLSF